jgi:serine/threonine-protein kinase HipA
MLKKEIGFVYLNKRFVGEVRRKNGDFIFEYDPSYATDPEAIALSISLPKNQMHTFQKLFPFFEGLLTEGWLKKIQEKTQQIDERDSFTRLLNNGKELMGAVSILTEKI